MEITVRGVQEMEAFARILGESAAAGDAIILSGDLGAGKTTMTKGIALGLGIEQMVKSPTYTIVREYSKGRIPLYHMDVYRIDGAAEDLALEEYFEGDGLSVVEWGQLLGEFLPEEYLQIKIEKSLKNEEQRELYLEGVGNGGAAFLERIAKLWRNEDGE